MSNNEYEQQQFWKEDIDPWKKFAKALSDYMKIRYNPKYYKSALKMLTDNHKSDSNLKYEWNIMKINKNGK